MPTPVEVSCVRRGGPARIEALGGVWQGQPWSMSESTVIAEIERPGRQWDFFATIDGYEVPIVVGFENDRKCLSAGHDPFARCNKDVDHEHSTADR
jgi:hypothetical protein